MTGRAVSALVSDASYAQARMYFLDELAHGSGAFTVARVLDLTGDLDPAALGAAVRGCVRRHESLRTCFRVIDGELRQIVTDQEPTPRVVDLRSLLGRETGVDERELVADLAGQEAAEPFDLRRVPLLRTTLIRLTDQRAVLLLTLHHIIADAWSLDVLLRELSALYRAAVAGVPDGLPELPLQYADFAAWQQRAEAGGGHDRLLAHWCERVRGLPELTLPTEHPRPERLSHRGRELSVPLDDHLAEQLGSLCREEEASLFMVLLAGFYVVLHRYSGRSDLAVGGTTSGRARPETQDVIGSFVNMVVLRTLVRDDHTLRDVLRATAETCHDAYDHQELPFERLVAAHGGARRANLHPLFQIVFQMIVQPEDDLSVPGLNIRMREPATTVSTFDLVCTVTNTNGRLSATLEYATELWDAETVAALGHAWQCALSELAARPDRAVRDTPLAEEHPYVPDALPDELRRARVLSDLPADAVLTVRDAFGHPAPRGAFGELFRRDRPGAPVTPTGVAVRPAGDGRLMAVPAQDAFPGLAPPEADVVHCAPVGPVERELAALWGEVLGVTDVGRNDNFFERGGHSLLATVLITRVHERYGTDVTLEAFFRLPTPAGLAEAIAASTDSGDGPDGGGTGELGALTALVDALEQGAPEQGASEHGVLEQDALERQEGHA
ncbi:condensation domain-containing protein [Streptomyces sp. NPDC058471]|uniref:condensation domain-containing protein n=1 Tax=Streptomyces sp. NPDC058471 TaxID=3346516 RepID=UPI0036475E74